MLKFEDIKEGTIWYTVRAPHYRVVVAETSPKVVGSGGWIRYHIVNDTHMMELDHWKFQIEHDPE